MKKKDFNERRIMKIIKEKGPISRIEISEQTNITKSTITRITEELLKDNIIVEQGTAPSARGRRPMLLTFNPTCYYAIGVQFGRQKVAIALTDLDGNILASRNRLFDFSEKFQTVLDFIHGSIDEVMDEADIQLERILGIGIGLPGPLNESQDGTISPPNFYDQQHIPLRDLFEKRHNLPVFLDHSSNVAALSEKWFGKGKGTHHLLYVFVESGIGAGLFIGGQLYRGINGEAGIIGHTTIDYDGVLCSCGNYGCLETLATIDHVEATVKKRLKLGSEKERRLYPACIEDIRLADVIRAEQHHSFIAAQIFEETGRYLGVGIANIVNLFDPQLVIIGGKLGLASPRIMEGIQETLKNRTLSHKSKRIPVLASELENPVVLGASALVIDDAFTLYSPFSS